MAAYPTPQISALFPRGIPDPYLREFEIRRQLRDAGIPGLNFDQNDTRYPAMQSLLYARPEQELDRQDARLRGRGHRRGRSEGEGAGRRGDRRSHGHCCSQSHTHSHGPGHGHHPRQRAVSDIRRDSSKGLESGDHSQCNGPRSRESGGRMANNDSDILAIPIPVSGGDFAAPAPVPTPFHRRHRSAEHVVRQDLPHSCSHSHSQQSQSRSQQTGQQTGNQPDNQPRRRPQVQDQVQGQAQAQAQAQPLIRVHDSNGDDDGDGNDDGDEGDESNEGTMTELLPPPPSYEEATMNMGTTDVGATDVGTMDMGSMDTDTGAMRREMQRGVTMQADGIRDGNRNRNRNRDRSSQAASERRVPLLQVLVV